MDFIIVTALLLVFYGLMRVSQRLITCAEAFLDVRVKMDSVIRQMLAVNQHLSVVCRTIDLAHGMDDEEEKS